MGEAYPELTKQQQQVEKILLLEEEQFAKTLDQGMNVLEAALKELSGKEIPGNVVFTLHDTYGFPFDLTGDIARERGLTLDEAGYAKCMEEQRARARAAGSFKLDYTDKLEVEGSSEFHGYSDLSIHGNVTALFKEGEAVEELQKGDEGVVVLDHTPFYAESGGQVGDCGYLFLDNNQFQVNDCQKQGESHIHVGEMLLGSIKVGDRVDAEVSADVRQSTALNHSATHLLHAALREVLGDHVQQKGSLVNSERLRFDFAHMEAISTEDLNTIERLVNELIRQNTEVETEICDLEEAQARGAMALFGEKYGEEVRVLSMGDGFSVELCGGIHAKRTGDIGVLRIVSESGIAAGVRRIEAVTGAEALALFEADEELIEDIAGTIKANRSNVLDKVQQLVVQNRDLEKELAALKSKLASAASGDLVSQAIDIGGLKVLAANLEGADPKSLRDMADQLKNKLGSGLVLLATADGDKVSLIVGVTKDATGKVKAGELMKHVAPLVGGKGGGRPDMAQGGGTDASGIDAVLSAVPEWVKQQLS